MEINLNGKNALVGGSSKGIGRAIAQRLVASGAQVTLMASSAQRLETVLAELDTQKGKSIRHWWLILTISLPLKQK